MIALEGSAVEAAAISQLYEYLARVRPANENDELIARDAYIQGFKLGGRWAIRTSSRLSDPDVQRAIAVMHEVMTDTDELLADGYREAHAERDAELATELVGLRTGILSGGYRSSVSGPTTDQLLEVVDRCLTLLTPPRRIAVQVTR